MSHVRLIDADIPRFLQQSPSVYGVPPKSLRSVAFGRGAGDEPLAVFLLSGLSWLERSCCTSSADVPTSMMIGARALDEVITVLSATKICWTHLGFREN
ncbi:hypothetical protein Aduo_012755 [Ancylostoma duodenale]